MFPQFPQFLANFSRRTLGKKNRPHTAPKTKQSEGRVLAFESRSDQIPGHKHEQDVPVQEAETGWQNDMLRCHSAGYAQGDGALGAMHLFKYFQHCGAEVRTLGDPAAPPPSRRTSADHFF